MPRAGLDSDAVVAAAAALADTEGLEAVTLARLASELGVRAPSVYAHVDGLGDLRRRLAIRGAGELAVRLQGAATGRAGQDALTAVADAYRAYAHDHPGTYAAVQQIALARDEEAQAAGADVVEVVLAVLRGYGLAGDDAIHATRALRSALHGFVSLEAQGGFGLPLDLDQSFAFLVTMVDRGLAGGAQITARGYPRTASAATRLSASNSSSEAQAPTDART
jgi:AcrR family transcriptional regulator